MPSAEKTKTEIAADGTLDRIQKKESLNGLAEIAAYLGISISTVRKYIKRYGMPAASFGGPGGKYLTTKTIVTDWARQSHLVMVIQHNWDRKANKPRDPDQISRLRTYE